LHGGKRDRETVAAVGGRGNGEPIARRGEAAHPFGRRDVLPGRAARGRAPHPAVAAGDVGPGLVHGRERLDRLAAAGLDLTAAGDEDLRPEGSPRLVGRALLPVLTAVAGGPDDGLG